MIFVTTRCKADAFNARDTRPNAVPSSTDESNWSGKQTTRDDKDLSKKYPLVRVLLKIASFYILVRFYSSTAFFFFFFFKYISRDFVLIATKFRGESTKCLSFSRFLSGNTRLRPEMKLTGRFVEQCAGK